MFTLSKKVIELARAGAENQQQELLMLLMDTLAFNDGEASVNDTISALRENCQVFRELNELENPAD